MALYELDPPGGPVQGDGLGKTRASRSGKHVAARESFRYLEHAPNGIVVVHGDSHTVVYANSSFRDSIELPENAIVGRPIADVLQNPSSDGLQNPPVPEVISLLNRVRGQPVPPRDADLSVSVDLNISAPLEAESGAKGSWRCMVWPVRAPVVDIDELVVELWHAPEEESSLIRQREIAERMLLSALREQALSDDNARLYGAANDARIVAEEAQVLAEGAQHEAETANSAKAEFLANMSHELRTPLNAIGGYAQLIEMGLRGPVTAAQIVDLGRIRRSQVHLLGLINAVLNYAKLEAGRVEYATQDFALDDLIIDVESMVHPQLEENGLRYHHAYRVGIAGEPRVTPVRVNADADKLRQILLNLLTNAIKFTSPGGQITVACQTVKQKVLLSVTDTGRGIPAAKLHTIFEPFIQIGRGLSSSDTGVGLGLAISRDLAIGMAGDLTVESVEGEGSTFTLILPLATDMSPAVAP
ncbi:MAG: ATP-binding protein [Gemmatimonadaceae bacterium]